jgi:hypothetical protein
VFGFRTSAGTLTEAVGGAHGGDELGLPHAAERGLDDGGDCVGIGGSLSANEHP